MLFFEFFDLAGVDLDFGVADVGEVEDEVGVGGGVLLVVAGEGAGDAGDVAGDAGEGAGDDFDFVAEVIGGAFDGDGGVGMGEHVAELLELAVGDGGDLVAVFLTVGAGAVHHVAVDEVEAEALEALGFGAPDEEEGGKDNAVDDLLLSVLPLVGLALDGDVAFVGSVQVGGGHDLGGALLGSVVDDGNVPLAFGYASGAVSALR